MKTVRKGRDFEIEIAKSLRESGLDPTAKRMPRSGAIEGLESDILTSLPINIEAKKQEKWDPLSYYEQAESETKHGEIPVVVMGKNRTEPFAFLKWKDLVYLMQLASESGHFVREYGYSKRRQLGK